MRGKNLKQPKSSSGGDWYDGTVCRSKKEWRAFMYGYGKISKTLKKKGKSRCRTVCIPLHHLRRYHTINPINLLPSF